ncbi:hypothetical protein HDU78_005813 [Chytriomyces hyalinus]|nr:hypothetical protein HDU78_005813 [Chytriomyces hyalinus]
MSLLCTLYQTSSPDSYACNPNTEFWTALYASCVPQSKSCFTTLPSCEPAPFDPEGTVIVTACTPSSIIPKDWSTLVPVINQITLIANLPITDSSPYIQVLTYGNSGCSGTPVKGELIRNRMCFPTTLAYDSYSMYYRDFNDQIQYETFLDRDCIVPSADKSTVVNLGSDQCRAQKKARVINNNGGQFTAVYNDEKCANSSISRVSYLVSDEACTDWKDASCDPSLDPSDASSGSNNDLESDGSAQLANVCFGSEDEAADILTNQFGTRAYAARTVFSDADKCTFGAYRKDAYALDECFDVVQDVLVSYRMTLNESSIVLSQLWLGGGCEGTPAQESRFQVNECAAGGIFQVFNV